MRYCGVRSSLSPQTPGFSTGSRLDALNWSSVRLAIIFPTCAPDLATEMIVSRIAKCMLVAGSFMLPGKAMKRGCQAALAAGCFCFALPAHAASYPDKPVRFIVAFPAGGNADLIARVVAQGLTSAFGRNFVIDNRGGAGGVVAEETTARAAPDGYTVLEVSLTHVVNPSLHKKLPYDPIRELAPVSVVASVPNVLVVHNSVNVKSVPELIALAKSRPGQLNYASSQGTSLHICGELFKAMAGVDIVNVNYRSGGVAVPDIEAGRVQMAFSSISTALAMAKMGRTRALAVTSAKRSQVAPDLPAIAEFVPGYEMTGWQGILVPAGTPHAIVNRLSQEITKIVRQPDVQQRLIGMGADPVGSTPEEFSRFRKAELAKLSKLMSQAGIKAE
jgi:tripartite-type tricarboxylate transporter receptor subunit TctC